MKLNDRFSYCINICYIKCHFTWKMVIITYWEAQFYMNTFCTALWSIYMHSCYLPLTQTCPPPPASPSPSLRKYRRTIPITKRSEIKFKWSRIKAIFFNFYWWKIYIYIITTTIPEFMYRLFKISLLYTIEPKDPLCQKLYELNNLL